MLIKLPSWIRTYIVDLSNGILRVPMQALFLNDKRVFSGTKREVFRDEHFIIAPWIVGAFYLPKPEKPADILTDLTRDRGLASHNKCFT